MTSYFLMNNGFSIGIGDVTPGERLLARKYNLLRAGYVIFKYKFRVCARIVLIADSYKKEEKRSVTQNLNVLAKICIGL